MGKVLRFECVTDKNIWRLCPKEQRDIIVGILGKLDADKSPSRRDVRS